MILLCYIKKYKYVGSSHLKTASLAVLFSGMNVPGSAVGNQHSYKLLFFAHSREMASWNHGLVLRVEATGLRVIHQVTQTRGAALEVAVTVQ